MQDVYRADSKATQCFIVWASSLCLVAKSLREKCPDLK
jgi:hypothetical protein